MANSPDAWVEDARNLDNAEQLLNSARGILLETPAIGDFLRNETNKRIVVAPKGYGNVPYAVMAREFEQTFVGPDMESLVIPTSHYPPDSA